MIRVLTAALLLLMLTVPHSKMEGQERGTLAATSRSRADLVALLKERNGEIINLFSDYQEIQYAPAAITEAIKDAQEEGFQSTVGVEGLFYYPVSDNSQFFKGTPSQQYLAIYNILRSISSMKGIEYYSASRQRWRTFYLDSYVIPSADAEQPLPDPLVASIPQESLLYIFQHDSSFGRNRYRAHYRYNDNSFLVSIHNLTTMRYLIFPMVRPSNMRILISILPTEEGLLYYGLCMVDVPNLFGFEERVSNSFSNRVRALYRWFASQMDSAKL